MTVMFARNWSSLGVTVMAAWLMSFAMMFAQTLPAGLSLPPGMTLEDAKKLQEQYQRTGRLPNAAANTGTSPTYSPVVRPPANQLDEPASVSPTEEVLERDERVRRQSILDIDARREDVTSSVVRYYRSMTGQVLPIFGLQTFQQAPAEGLTLYNTFGDDYRLAPGDVLDLSIRGIRNLDQMVRVDRQGFVKLSDYRPLRANGKTLAMFRDDVRRLAQTSDRSADVFVGIATARNIPVTVTGEVAQPQTMALPAYAPLSLVLGYVGGVTNSGSLRQVVMMDRQGKRDKVDLYQYLEGDINFTEPVIQEGARIHIPPLGGTVAAFGFVRRPAIFELSPNQEEIAVKDLLRLSGAGFLPPGAVLESLRLDENGQVVGSVLSNIEEATLRQGEALRVSVMETRDDQRVSLKGAVLSELSLPWQQGLDMATALRDGAALRNDAQRLFALHISRTHDEGVAAINLDDAFANPQRYPLHPGDELVVFTKTQYFELLDAPFDGTKDIAVDLVRRARPVEIFLDDKRVALLAPQDGMFRADALGFGANIPRTAVRNFMLHISDQFASAVEAFDGDQALAYGSMSDIGTDVLQGDRIQIFSGQRMQALLGTDFDRARGPIETYIRDAQPISVRFDGKRIAFVAPGDGVTVEKALQGGTFIPLDADKDFAVISKDGFEHESQAISLRDQALEENEWKLEAGDEINIFSRDQLAAILEQDNVVPQNRNERLIAAVMPAEIFLDEQRVALVPSGSIAPMLQVVQDILDSPRTYPAYILDTRRDEDGFALKIEVNTKRGFRQKMMSRRLVPGQRLDFFSTSFIREQFTLDEKETSSNALAPLLATSANVENAPRQNLNQAEDEATFQARILEKTENVRSRSSSDADGPKEISQALRAQLLADARMIVGAVANPGLYPVALPISLDDAIALAGGLLDGADKKRVALRQYEDPGSGVFALTSYQVMDLTSGELGSTSLGGYFDIQVPQRGNDANIGTVTLTGEVRKPGRYVVARGETLEDLLIRAGGLTETAFPFGAVFTKTALEEQQKEANQRTANRVESSLLDTSFQNMDRTQEISAIQRYASLLRAAQPTGRQVIDLLSQQDTGRILLADGDTLFVPQRPSSVTVAGEVLSPSTVFYRPGQEVSDYINNAGGFTALADSDRVYMVLPNGEAKKVDLGRFTLRDLPVTAGSIIFVPPDTTSLSGFEVTELVAGLVSNIASAALGIGAIVNQ